MRATVKVKEVTILQVRGVKGLQPVRRPGPLVLSVARGALTYRQQWCFSIKSFVRSLVRLCSYNITQRCHLTPPAPQVK